jgi:hypothetical protein
MIVNFFFQIALLTFFAQFYRDFYLEYKNVNNMFMHRNKKKKLKNNVFFFLNQAVTLNSNKSAF